LVTEQGNPGDLANIVRAIVEVPSPRLQRGILLIETPGLGSLAKRSATETLAYLLSADLALLLIDAGTTLSEEDLGTLRLLYGVGIPALGLLSKADLLASKDLQAVLWTHIGPVTRISSLQLSESIHNVIWQFVQRPVEQLLQNDLELLRNWNATNMAELAEKRA
jgi:predicted GTPase